MNQPLGTVSGLPFSSMESYALLILLAIWVIYTAIAAYHWFAYGGFTHRGVPTLAVHVVVSALFFLYALSGVS